MTNIIAVVAICIISTTNEVPRYEAAEFCDGADSWTMYYDNAQKSKYRFKIPIHLNMPPEKNQRVRIVTKKKITKLSFDWNGKKREIKDEQILDERRILLTKKTTWIQSNPTSTEKGQ